jgi:Tol biopolymer transport system component
MMASKLPPEHSTYTDSSTATTVIQWTSACYTNQHLYFTSPSVTADDRWLTIISDRSGSPNLYAIDRRNGTIRRLSHNESGLLHSYVYPQGGAIGLSKASPCLDPIHNRIFYIRDDTVYAVEIDQPEATEQKVCALPAQWYGAFTHVSPDGKTLCVPCTDPRAFVDEVSTQWEQMRAVPVCMRKQGLVTRIYLIDTETGESRIAAEVPFWVTHVQFDPTGTGHIIFNQEGFIEETGNPLPDRIWCLELNGSFRPLAPQPKQEWRSHENWAPDGKSIIYHGGRRSQAFVAARTWQGELLRETSLEGIKFYHATGVLDGQRLLVDRPDGFISILDPDAAGENRIVNLCRHDTTIEDQDAHAHPIATLNGKHAIFTSNRTGYCQVYEVMLPRLR